MTARNRELVPALRNRSHQDGDETQDRNRERQQSKADGNQELKPAVGDRAIGHSARRHHVLPRGTVGSSRCKIPRIAATDCSGAPVVQTTSDTTPSGNRFHGR